MNIRTCLAGAAATLVFGTAGSALAQPISSGNGGAVLGGTPAARTANAAAGDTVNKAGQAVIVGSGAHGGGPAPVVSGAVPETKPFTSGVTDAGAKVGKGLKGTGDNISRSGVTASPAGAAKGASSAPAGLARQANRAEAVAGDTDLNTKRSRNVSATAEQAAGDGVYKAGQATIIASGAHGGGPAPVVSGAVPQTKPFTSGVTDAGAKAGKGMKGTGANIADGGVTVSPKGAKRGAASAPGALQTQANRAARIPN